MPPIEPIPPLRLPSGVVIPMAVIPPVAVQQDARDKGEPLSFLMGSRGFDTDEEPRHRVIIPAPFYLGTTPITQAQFAAFKPEHQNGFPDKPAHPAENIDWHEARAFCDWINEQCQDQLPRGYRACLPSEAQWEYACRSGTDTEYHTGDGAEALKEAGWFDQNAGGSTHPVGELKPNAWDLSDMHGQVWEWCADAWDAQAYAKREDGWHALRPDTSDKESRRVVRGGSWGYSPGRCRSACRGWWGPRIRFRFQGFRLCLSSGLVVQAQAKPGAEPWAGAGREGRPEGGSAWRSGHRRADEPQ